MRNVSKTNVKKVTIHNEPYFQKWYVNQSTLSKVISIHEQLETIRFPYFLKLHKINEDNIIQKWLTNYEVASYEKATHRKLVLNALTALHETNQQINWLESPLHRLNLKHKWIQRVYMFEQIIDQLPSTFQSQKKWLLERATHALTTFNFNDSVPSTICHGDVAHHNFLVCDKDIKIIDFDLAYIGNPEDEIILWMQRVLPFMDYNLEGLIKENPSLLNFKDRFSMLLFPNELLRETIHSTKLEGKAYKRSLEFLHWLFEVTINNDKKFQEVIEFIQNNDDSMLK